MRLIARALMGLFSASNAAVNMTGAWVLDASYLEGYTITPSSPDLLHFAVTCSQGPCTAWRTANISLAAASTAVHVDFDTGVQDDGALTDAPYFDAIAWSRSAWRRAPPARALLTVHVVPASHNDPGWLRTFYELFNESHAGVNDFAVRDIYSSIVRTLSVSPNRTFGSELTVFWSQWWAEAGVAERAAVRALVARGQLEFTGGGWTQNDEAITRFEDMVDQMTLGHLWAASALGSPPVTTGWQADPFGHSSTFAFLLAGTAADGLVLGRPMGATWPGGGQPDPIDSADALWHPFASFPDGGVFDAHTLRTHVQRFGYWEPYRSMRGALQKGDTAAAATTLAGFLETLAAQRPAAANALVMWGDDFELGDAETMFPAMEAVFATLNARAPTPLLPALNLSFSTPSRFYRALAAEGAAAAAAPRPTWDMLPLIGCEFPAPWTGFYVSRPDFKMLFHAASAFRRAAVALHALARDASRWSDDAGALLPLWTAVGLVQHHDAITGDSYDNVMEDYKQYLGAGLEGAGGVAAAAAAALLGGGGGGAPCFNASAAPCADVAAALSEGRAVTLTAYNPLPWVRDEYVELLLPTRHVEVTDARGGAVPAQVGPVEDVDADPRVPYALTFLAAALPPLGLSTFTVAPVAPGAPGEAAWAAPEPLSAPGTLSNGLLELRYGADGALLELHNAGDGTRVAVSAQLLLYTSAAGRENGWDFSTGGANYTHAVPPPGGAPAATATVGPLWSQVRAQLAPGFSTRFRVYGNEAAARIATGVGPFPALPESSQDALLRFTLRDFANGGGWATDANGLELRARARDARPWWPPGAAGDPAEPVSSNFFPVTALASISAAPSGAGATIALLPELTSHGAASPAEGVLDLTLSRGVAASGGFPALANRHVTLRDVLAVHGSSAASAAAARPLASRLANPLLLLAAAAPTGAGAARARAPPPPFSPLAAPLPPAVELLTLALLPAGLNVSAAAQGNTPAAGTAAPAAAPRGPQPPLAGAALLLRLRHIFAAGEGSLAGPVVLDLAAAFAPRWNVTAAREMTLTATRGMEEARAAQIQWQQLGGSGAPAAKRALYTAAGGTTVTLQPMEIKTWLLTLG
jgi:hypothetical protein